MSSDGRRRQRRRAPEAGATGGASSILWIVAERDRDAARRDLPRARDPARQRQRAGDRARCSTTPCSSRCCTPVLLFVVLFLASTRSATSGPRRHRSPTGRADRGDSGSRSLWVVVTTVTVFVARRVRHLRARRRTAPAAVRGRAAPSCPPTMRSAMDVQVIGQQWEFTYRYPSYGGVETPHLVLPAEHPDPAARHLARRHPLLLGLPARRQGRRQPRRRQRRLRQD